MSVKGFAKVLQCNNNKKKLPAAINTSYPGYSHSAENLLYLFTAINSIPPDTWQDARKHTTIFPHINKMIPMLVLATFLQGFLLLSSHTMYNNFLK